MELNTPAAHPRYSEGLYYLQVVLLGSMAVIMAWGILSNSSFMVLHSQVILEVVNTIHLVTLRLIFPHTLVCPATWLLIDSSNQAQNTQVTLLVTTTHQATLGVIPHTLGLHTTWPPINIFNFSKFILVTLLIINFNWVTL